MSTAGINRAQPATGVPDSTAGASISAPSPPPAAAAEPRASPVPLEAQGTASPQYAQKVAEAINSSPDFRKVEARVYLDKGSDRYVLMIFSRSSGQLIRQYPPEGILDMASKLKAGTLGSFLDELA